MSKQWSEVTRFLTRLVSSARYSSIYTSERAKNVYRPEVWTMKHIYKMEPREIEWLTGFKFAKTVRVNVHFVQRENS